MCSWYYKKFNVKVFNLISRTNETRHIEWHETCKCKCRLDAIVYDNKQRWNKSCDIGEYLDYENCKCRKRLIDKLVDECTETVEEVKPAIITLAENENSYKCSSCTVYTMLFWIYFG